MTMQLLAHFELQAVELSPTFQVAALALQRGHTAVRISLEGKGSTSEENATEFEIVAIELDAFSRIATVQLNARAEKIGSPAPLTTHTF